MKSFIIELKEKEDGDLYLELPPELLIEAGWLEGDSIEFTEKDDGSVSLKKIYT